MTHPGGPAGAQRRNDSKAGVIDAARWGKARAEAGLAQAPDSKTPAGLRLSAAMLCSHAQRTRQEGAVHDTAMNESRPRRMEAESESGFLSGREAVNGREAPA